MSGLIANQAKSCAYFGGVSDDMQQLILQHTGFLKGLLPFRYLDVSEFKEAVSRAMPTTNRHDNGQNYNMDS